MTEASFPLPDEFDLRHRRDAERPLKHRAESGRVLEDVENSRALNYLP